VKPVHQKKRRTWLLVPSYLTGPEAFRGVSEVLTLLGQDSILASPARTTPADTDHIGPWVASIVEAAGPPQDQPLVVVGHSASCPRLPLVAASLLEVGHRVEAVILVNGRFPADDGLSPVEADSTLADLLDDMVRPDDYLPPWHHWWGGMVVDMLPVEDRDRVLADFKPVPRALFDQPIPVPKLPGEVRMGFLATGEMYLMAYDRAEAEGWLVAHLEGEHLHVVVDPVSVAGTLISLVGRPRTGAGN
jgi:hypothetical protein